MKPFTVYSYYRFYINFLFIKNATSTFNISVFV